MRKISGQFQDNVKISGQLGAQNTVMLPSNIFMKPVTRSQRITARPYIADATDRKPADDSVSHSLELSPGFHPGPDNQFGLFQTAA